MGSTPSFPSSSLQGHILPADHLKMMGPLNVGPRGVEEATQEVGVNFPFSGYRRKLEAPMFTGRTNNKNMVGWEGVTADG